MSRQELFLNEYATGGLKKWKAHEGFILDSVNGYDVLECQLCKFAHVVPIPDESELQRVYHDEYYGEEKPNYLEEHSEDLDWWNVVHGERYERIEQLLGQQSGRLCDIGSGPGSFLLSGKSRGWDTLGIEPSSQAAAQSRAHGANVVEEFLTPELAHSLGRFDAIQMSEVLEHHPDPQKFLKIARMMMDPQGVLCVVVPNDYNPLQRAVQQLTQCESWWVAPPHHLNYFTLQSLCHLLAQCGFSVVDSHTTFPMEFFLLMGEHYIGNDKLGRNCHKKRMQFELNLSQTGLQKEKATIFRNFAALGIGRELVVYAKPNVQSPEQEEENL
ncbi:class I SAM-dependent methyltransferase [Candidatus Nitronereus thalassa]|uniref:Class I SAM-dependent methyltransferase n=1 Tax=Candidatus Nitronereus thalassa TaxID=3020898 RepID=A0ABU3K675_9BACT|nr:class I SAM-dependent methyltransferase [Candidatus Nitronereus thalassa]MDT7041848.1 class I SAM-dependent methyltransferase [Candidatus Nitronereus thalassa]